MSKTSVLLLFTLATMAACGRSERDGTPGSSKTASGQAATAEQARYADENRDGRVTRNEARSDPYLAASFDRYDVDANNELDRAEFARLETRAAEREDEQDPEEDTERHQLRPRREFPRPYD